MGRGPILKRSPFFQKGCPLWKVSGISTSFPVLSRALGQVTHALLTRPPLGWQCFIPKDSTPTTPLDLHVLGTPPAFVLSQDQTLHRKFVLSESLSLVPNRSGTLDRVER